MPPAERTSTGRRLFGGVDIGGTKLLAVVADGQGKILAREKKKVRPDKGFKDVCVRSADALREACRAAGVETDALAAVGIGAPSPILPDGTAIAAPNLGWKNEPLVKTFAHALGRPVFAENDCNAGTYGEYIFGAGRGARTLAGFFMGTGLGGGLVLHGELLTGENHQAVELGHIIVVEGGRRCGCGHLGCLEAYASKAGMARKLAYEIVHQGRPSVLSALAPDGNFRALRSSALAEAWAAGDEVAVETLREAAHFLGVGVANLVTMLGPDVVVVGGGVYEALGKALLPITREAARMRTWPTSSFKDTRIVLATLGDDAVALGAVAYARDRLDATLVPDAPIIRAAAGMKDASPAAATGASQPGGKAKGKAKPKKSPAVKSPAQKSTPKTVRTPRP